MGARNVRRFEELLRAGRWFGNLDATFRGELLDAAELRPLRQGEWLFARGDPPSGLFGVVEGSVRIAGTVAGASDPREFLLARVEPPMWFGEVSVIDGQPRTHDAIADVESTLVHVPQAELVAMLDREPRRYRDLGLLVSTKLRIAFAALEDAAQPLLVRLARRLLLTVERYGEWQDRTSRVVDLKQAELATMLSASRPTVNQLLKELASRGIVRLGYGHVEIVDLDGLRSVAGTGA